MQRMKQNNKYTIIIKKQNSNFMLTSHEKGKLQNCTWMSVSCSINIAMRKNCAKYTFNFGIYQLQKLQVAGLGSSFIFLFGSLKHSLCFYPDQAWRWFSQQKSKALLRYLFHYIT